MNIALDESPTTSYARVEEILDGYGTDSVVGRYIRQAAPDIHESVARVPAHGPTRLG
ncbi:hypothetical protein ACGF3G_13370 [Streptomyces sp. NPDC048179]|uniref:hypothetical protein n=1 Tax=Streptomyces sp. NPDC048179 TaxID=3365506 RepID=UPI0037101B02